MTKRATHALRIAPAPSPSEGAAPSIPAPPGDASKAVCAALRALVEQRKAGDPRGVLLEEMAIACGVTHQQMGKVLDGSRALTPRYLVRLPQRAYDAALAVMARCRRAPAPLSDDEKTGFLLELLGERAARLRRAKADGIIDDQERSELENLDALIAAMAVREVRP